jgi:hypothetical protein
MSFLEFDITDIDLAEYEHHKPEREQVPTLAVGGLYRAMFRLHEDAVVQALSFTAQIEDDIEHYADESYLLGFRAVNAELQAGPYQGALYTDSLYDRNLTRSMLAIAGLHIGGEPLMEGYFLRSDASALEPEVMTTEVLTAHGLYVPADAGSLVTPALDHD